MVGLRLCAVVWCDVAWRGEGCDVERWGEVGWGCGVAWPTMGSVNIYSDEQRSAAALAD